MLIVSCRVHEGTFIRITMTPTVSRCSSCALRNKVKKKKKKKTPLVSSSPATDIRSRQHLKSVSRLDRPIAVSVATQTTIIILIVIVAVVMLIFSYNICPCLLAPIVAVLIMTSGKVRSSTLYLLCFVEDLAIVGAVCFFNT